MSQQRRNALGVGLAMILGLLGCGVLYGPLIGPNPNHCANNPSICTESQQCNMQTGFCVDAALDLSMVAGSDLAAADLAPTGPTLSLLAGGLGGSGNGDGTGTAARFYDPTGVAVDGAGTLFIADQDNHTIRKVVPATGAVTTLAGSAGMSGSTDGTGSAARFASPYGIAVDGAGNLFVAQGGTNTIRKVVIATGAVTTLAGSAGMSGSTDGTGGAARFKYPQGLAADGAGNLFVADNGNHTIRKVVIATGTVTTLAGSAGTFGSTDGTGTAARFYFPYGVAVDGAGNLFVADTANHAIRKVVIATGAVTTLAGSVVGSTDGTGAAAGFSSPEGVAVDGAGNLFVADTGNSTIRNVVIATGAVSTLAGRAGVIGISDATGTSAAFRSPKGVAVDGAGNLLIADYYNDSIRKVVIATRAVTTLAGMADVPYDMNGTGAAARFHTPSGVTLESAGSLFVAETQGETLRKVVITTGAVTTLAGSYGMTGSTDGTGSAARFNHSHRLAADGAGNLFVVDTNNHTIRKVVIATGDVTTLAGSPGLSGSTDGTGGTARFNTPYGVAVDGAGDLFISDYGNHTIRKVVIATGTVTTVSGTAGMSGSADGTGSSARFYLPQDVAADGAGNLFVADTFNHTIRKVVIATGAVTTLAGTAGMSGSTDGTGAAALFNKPASVAVDGAGNLLVADTNNHTIRKVVIATGVVTTLVGVAGSSGVTLGALPARLNTPLGVAVSPSGEIYITSENSVLVVR